jgi:hypothetical protein
VRLGGRGPWLAAMSIAGAALVASVACTSGSSASSFADAGEEANLASGSDANGCPPTPAHCASGTLFNDVTCSCDPVPCTTDADCQALEGVVCDTSTGKCAQSSSVAKCAAVFTCGNTVQPGGTCDCHEDCQCDPGNASGKGATYCLGAGGSCIPRCDTQSDPAQFCECFQHGTTCAANGACEATCKTLNDCFGNTCTSGLCDLKLDPSINLSACSDAGVTDAAPDDGG